MQTMILRIASDPFDAALSRAQGLYNHHVNPKPLIDAALLGSRIASGDCVVVDCRFDLSAPHQGFARYLDGHIPGARYAHLDKDLAGPVTPTSGRHPLPEIDDLAASLGAFGIDARSYVVAYDDAGGAVAARLWWLLRWLGHGEAAVLDGGFAAWRAFGGPLATRIPAWQPSRYRPRTVGAEWVVTTMELEGALARGARLLDARAGARFRGASEPVDPVAGHIPGAANLPFSECLSAEQRFLPRERLAALFAAQGLRGEPQPEAVAMCGSGVTACHLLLAMEVAGLPPGKLYAGSWSEWIRDPKRRVATGDDAS
jgi:thiosulfate/3-mercaptopyruvate sulfurtransferase